MSIDNPYLKPAVPIPFDQLALDQIELAIAALLAESNAAFDSIESDESIRTYDNTLEAMELATENLDRALHKSFTCRIASWLTKNSAKYLIGLCPA